LVKAGINVWDANNGFRPFIRWNGDTSRGAGNLGTDGVDLVWSYGEGKGPGEEPYPIRSVMTAPYTTDPDAVVPRRLRSQLANDIALDSWKVGCGRAVHFGALGLQVVRLSDGWSWEIPYAPNRGIHTPIGITCDEVFALGSVGDHSTIARVRLDSLGPGTAPD
jgi:hypothetical protein